MKQELQFGSSSFEEAKQFIMSQGKLFINKSGVGDDKFKGRIEFYLTVPLHEKDNWTRALSSHELTDHFKESISKNS